MCLLLLFGCVAGSKPGDLCDSKANSQRYRPAGAGPGSLCPAHWVMHCVPRWLLTPGCEILSGNSGSPPPLTDSQALRQLSWAREASHTTVWGPAVRGGGCPPGGVR